MHRPLLPVFLLCSILSAADNLAILPNSIELNNPEARQHLLAEANVGDHQEDWTRNVKWHSSDHKIAIVDANGEVRPMGDGEATITAAARGRTADVTVRVKNAQTPYSWSFRNDVIPVMTKVGCNQGACHGALAGKNGFKLTLRGYDPDVDYDTLTRQSVGRRIDPEEPARSLMLLKPTMSVPHGGGKRFDSGSLEYRILSGWIAQGMPRPHDDDPQVTVLEVFPASARLAPGAEQQLVVRAKYSNGQVRDITRWVKFSSSEEGVASVDDLGHVKMNGNGEAAITLWYSSRVLYSRVSVPYPNKVDAAVYEKFPRHNYIDELVLDKLQTLNLAPAQLCDDSTFIRRSYLDAAGILPTAEEVQDFLADRSSDRRTKLIDKLLDRDELVDYWAYKWSDLLLVSSRKLRSNAMWSFYNWIRESVKNDKPWDQFAREIFTSSGNTRKNGALNYFVIHKDPIDIAENATQAFMGQNVKCARCHNHPLEKWTQKQYYQFANLFARVSEKNGAEPGALVIFAKTSGNINHPRLLKPLPPTPLDGASIPLDSRVDRRLPFANWLTSKDNTYFQRAIVNRIWGNFMGRGIVDPVDDVRATNPASNEELFAALCKDFVEHGFHIKHMIRTIMNSATYQLSADANATNQNDNKYYSKYIVKRLPAEVLLDAMSQVTGVPSQFNGYPATTRALQLPDTQVNSEFLASFGRPPRLACDAAERSSAPSVAQALHVINGDTLNRKLMAPDAYPALAIKLGLSDSDTLDHLFLTAYSRYPTDAEKQPILVLLRKARMVMGSAETQREARRRALEDMMWALLTSKEFLFNY